ncbi:hypothetical protein CC2G_004784 [Coprinopsis cinerea AmutBmut pab1-1]|nr:hypothetical protein CC2G_004784 [Coprinopsis cinerea AmutBmut pab1-1]
MSASGRLSFENRFLAPSKALNIHIYDIPTYIRYLTIVCSSNSGQWIAHEDFANIITQITPGNLVALHLSSINPSGFPAEWLTPLLWSHHGNYIETLTFDNVTAINLDHVRRHCTNLNALHLYGIDPEFDDTTTLSPPIPLRHLSFSIRTRSRPHFPRLHTSHAREFLTSCVVFNDLRTAVLSTSYAMEIEVLSLVLKESPVLDKLTLQLFTYIDIPRSNFHDLASIHKQVKHLHLFGLISPGSLSPIFPVKPFATALNVLENDFVKEITIEIRWVFDSDFFTVIDATEDWSSIDTLLASRKTDLAVTLHFHSMAALDPLSWHQGVVNRLVHHHHFHDIALTFHPTKFHLDQLIRDADTTTMSSVVSLATTARITPPVLSTILRYVASCNSMYLRAERSHIKHACYVEDTGDNNSLSALTTLTLCLETTCPAK